LAAAMRRAGSKRAEVIRGPTGSTLGYRIDLSAISVAEENLFFNYDDSEAAMVRFKNFQWERTIALFSRTRLLRFDR